MEREDGGVDAVTGVASGSVTEGERTDEASTLSVLVEVAAGFVVGKPFVSCGSEGLAAEGV